MRSQPCPCSARGMRAARMVASALEGGAARASCAEGDAVAGRAFRPGGSHRASDRPGGRPRAGRRDGRPRRGFLRGACRAPHLAHGNGGAGSTGRDECALGGLALRRVEETMHRCWERCCASAVISVLLLGSCVRPAPAPEVATSRTDPIEAAFVVLGAGGQPLARVITRTADCPVLQVDDLPQTMTVRATPATVPQRPTMSAPEDSKPSAFPVLVCDAMLARGVHRAIVGGQALPVPRLEPRRIVVIGDTGCRIKTADGVFQACNDPLQWPFAQVAAAAAAMRPDLVIHVGDYHYRENACPPDNDAWKADFFAPARPLLEAAPWIVVRGNHESCNRAGQGWWRLLDPHPLVPQRDCNDAANDNVGDYSEPYAVPVTRDTQFIIFGSSKVGLAPLAIHDPMYLTYSLQLQQAFALGGDVAHNFFANHHP